MHDALHHVLTTVAASGAHLYFGICQHSVYLGGETCCRSTGSPLQPVERDRSVFPEMPETCRRPLRRMALINTDQVFGTHNGHAQGAGTYRAQRHKRAEHAPETGLRRYKFFTDDLARF